MHLGESHTFQSKFSTFQCKFSSLLVKKKCKICCDLRALCGHQISQRSGLWRKNYKYLACSTSGKGHSLKWRSQCTAASAWQQKNILFLTFLRTFTQQHFHTVQNSRFSFLLNIFSKLNLWRPCFAYSSLPVAARGSRDQNG